MLLRSPLPPEPYPGYRMILVQLLVYLLVPVWVFAQAESGTGSGAVVEFEAVFEAPVFVPQAGDYGLTELMIAARLGEVGVVRSLIGSGSDVNALDQSGGTALMAAAYGGHADIVEILLLNGADIDVVSSSVTTAVGNAMLAGHADVAVKLLEAGANPNVPRIYGDTLLEYAIRKKQTAVVHSLLESGADLTTQGPAALYQAVRNQDLELVRLFIEAGVDVNEFGSAAKVTPLYSASARGNTGIVNLLLGNGAIADKSTNEGLPLAAAVRSGQIGVVESLLQHGARARVRHISYAIQERHADIAMAILGQLDLRAISSDEFEELLSAADRAGDMDVIRLLWEASGTASTVGDSVRLLYQELAADECKIMRWNSGDNSIQSVYSDAAECAGGFYVASRGRTLFVLNRDRIQVLPLDGASAVRDVRLPTDEINEQLKILQANISIRYQGRANGDGMTANPVAVGLLESGEIGILVTSYGPADEAYAYLYGFMNQQWVLLDEKQCGRLDARCDFRQLDGRSIADWPPQRAVWHANLRGNPYFVRKDFGVDSWTGSVGFVIDGVSTTISFVTDTHGHCSGECIFTRRLRLEAGSHEPIEWSQVSGNQSIASHYILLPRAGGVGSELYDMRDGSSVLGPIGIATWVE